MSGTTVYSMRGGQDSYPCWAVRIDRRTKWGNPFAITAKRSRKQAIEQFEKWLLSRPALVAAVKRELRGKDLLCWCAPLPCHGDVLLRIANAPESPPADARAVADAYDFGGSDFP